ncbi:MAG: RnfABCDGE type electron transport complex subunit A [Gammaproteobacteria bacterium]|nr:RnfABCDGE type electron transport complex subunit A [Gammaproteobacteria bacterium]
MSDAPHWAIFVNAALINNFVLAYFLGLCPFMGVSAKLQTAVRMSGAVTFVMLVASLCAFLLNELLLWVDAPYLRLISYVLVIASTVQLVEMLLRKLSPATFRALGIFLPLITTNCAILGVALFQTNRGYGFSRAIVFALGAAAGFTLALVLMAGIREKLDLVAVPESVKGATAALVVAGILSLSFMGFAGLGS